MNWSGPVIRLRSPAKLNLYLEIKGRRPDGYHELVMLNTGIDLADTVLVKAGSGAGIQIECDDPQVPLDEGNLCHRAAMAFFQAFPGASAGLQIKIVKRIPVAGGLGGGSGNAAAVLFALARLTGAKVTLQELIGLGARVGADVPFFLFRSPAWVAGVGEIMEDADPLPAWTFLIVRQKIGVSTRWAFAQYDLTKTPDKLEYSGDHGTAPAKWKLRNDLEPVVAARHPEVALAKDVLLEAGASGAMMSGSGPTVFAVFDNEASAEKARDVAVRSLGCVVILSRALQGPLLQEF